MRAFDSGMKLAVEVDHALSASIGEFHLTMSM